MKNNENQTSSQNTMIAPAIAGTQYVSYLGQVAVKLMKGNKVLKTTTYHNSGMPSLFKFLCNCLAGTFTETLRPCKIKFFCYDAAWSNKANVAPGNFNWTEAFSNTSTAPYEVTPYVVYENTPLVDFVQGDTLKGTFDHYTTTFHFRVPYSLISGDMIHMVGIYPNNAIRNSDASAYYLFTKTEKNGSLSWDPIILENINGNFSIVLDWVMSVSNKTKADETVAEDTSSEVATANV